MNDKITGTINATHHLIYKYQLNFSHFLQQIQQNTEHKTETMSPPPLPLPVDHHIFISNNGNNKLNSGRIDLLLGLALNTSTTAKLSLSPTTTTTTSHTKQTSTYGYEQQQPSLTLSLLFPASTTTQQQNMPSRDNNCDDISSFSNSFVSVKREREDPEDSTASDSYEEDVSNTVGGRKKKLRLNKQQSTLLEDSFKLHTTLNHKQKEALARQLNLRPRQVEVWFQNRRARRKLKQTEVDCEFLKKYCERLAEENEKLHEELQHLKSLNKQQPFFLHHLPLPPTSRSRLNASTNYNVCPSFHQHQQVLPAPPNNRNDNFLISSKKRTIFSPFTKDC